MVYGIGNAENVTFPAYKHPLYWRWVNMIGRCYYKDHTRYESYGAKGIFVETYLLNFANYVSFVSQLPNYNNLLCDPEKWQVDKDKLGGKCYSRDTIQIIPAEENLHIENSSKQTSVEMLSESGEPIQRFESMSAAEKITGISRGNISRSARQGFKAGGYTWRYCIEPI